MEHHLVPCDRSPARRLGGPAGGGALRPGLRRPDRFHMRGPGMEGRHTLARRRSQPRVASDLRNRGRLLPGGCGQPEGHRFGTGQCAVDDRAARFGRAGVHSPPGGAEGPGSGTAEGRSRLQCFARARRRTAGRRPAPRDPAGVGPFCAIKRSGSAGRGGVATRRIGPSDHRGRPRPHRYCLAVAAARGPPQVRA